MTLSDPDVTPENPGGSGNGLLPAEAAPPKRSPAEVQERVVSYLARHLNTHPGEIDVTVPFEHFAVDSASTIEISGHIEVGTLKIGWGNGSIL